MGKTLDLTDEITVFINAIRELSGAGICYYDLKNFFNYERYGIKNNRGHYCGFCERTRALPGGRESCERSDKGEVIALAKQYDEPFFYECHMGMRELVIPLKPHKELLGILFVGQCRIEENNFSRILPNIRRIGGDAKEFLHLYEELPMIEQRDLLNVGKLLSGYFDAKIWNRELLPGGMSQGPRDTNLPEAIAKYISANYKYRLSTGAIAKEFFVNASYASRSFSQAFHRTITEEITRVRMEHAKRLLKNTDAPIGSIALNVGFEDVNYFSRVFKGTEGARPVSTVKSERISRKKRLFRCFV